MRKTFIGVLYAACFILIGIAAFRLYIGELGIWDFVQSILTYILVLGVLVVARFEKKKG